MRTLFLSNFNEIVVVFADAFGVIYLEYPLPCGYYRHGIGGKCYATCPRLELDVEDFVPSRLYCGRGAFHEQFLLGRLCKKRGPLICVL